jgi:hypothetical protein
MHFSQFGLKPVVLLLGGIDELDIGYIQFTLMMTKYRHSSLSHPRVLSASHFNKRFLI